MSYLLGNARCVVIAIAGIALASPVFAQDAPPTAAPAAAPEEARSGVEEIIITSTKRDQNIQDVPIAVSAFTGEDLLNRGIDEVEELEEISPSIQINTSNSASNGGTIRIRGMGTTGNNPGLESAVGSFVDGVYRSRAGQTFGDLLDIERVESSTRSPGHAVRQEHVGRRDPRDHEEADPRRDGRLRLG